MIKVLLSKKNFYQKIVYIKFIIKGLNQILTRLEFKLNQIKLEEFNLDEQKQDFTKLFLRKLN